jgi:GAF domain-containing protein
MPDSPTPDAAQAVIAQQAAEIERLRRQIADQRFATDLREALTLASAVNTIASPASHDELLTLIVETAAQIINAHAAALFLIDAATQELVFEVALGQKAHEVKKFRVPLGHGIAGLVAVTGQAIAVSDAQADPRQAADIARATGYVPRNILCVPLIHDEEIVGVLELLDKQGAPSFSPTDMEILGHFAAQAAVAIEHSRTHEHLAALLDEVLETLEERLDTEQPELRARAAGFAESTEADPHYVRALDLARLVQAIVWSGEGEAQACQAILQGFYTYLQDKARPLADWGSRR